jgi:hypothetical protein
VELSSDVVADEPRRRRFRLRLTFSQRCLLLRTSDGASSSRPPPLRPTDLEGEVTFPRMGPLPCAQPICRCRRLDPPRPDDFCLRVDCKETPEGREGGERYWRYGGGSGPARGWRRGRTGATAGWGGSARGVSLGHCRGVLGFVSTKSARNAGYALQSYRPVTLPVPRCGEINAKGVLEHGVPLW